MNFKKIKLLSLFFALVLCTGAFAAEVFPDGTPIPDWFRQNEPTDINKLGKHYRITDYGVVNDSTIVQTEQIQAVIDRAAGEGGGVIIIPKGTFLSGGIFFKPGTHLHIEEGGVLKGSDYISDFKVQMTRIEGEWCRYICALVNADGVDGFTLSGKGTINGNGTHYWQAFWMRRQWNPQCTNKDEMRPRLVFVSNSKNVQLSGVRLINSPFWTTHIYKCENIKLLDLYIYAPSAPVRAPSSDAVDVDVCTNVLIKNCYMSVNDDAIALKGGKGPTADKDPTNGGNFNVIIEDCTYGYCHGALTCGSESIHNRNIILRRITINHAVRLLWLKMRTDTPQNYEYITVEDIKGTDIDNFLYIQPWNQFFDLKGQTEIPMSYGSNVTMRNIDIECSNFFNVSASEQYKLSNFTFENLNLKVARNTTFHPEYVENFKINNVIINGEKLY